MQNDVNERIKMLRTHLNLTQQEFSNKTGISIITVSKIETGDTAPSKSTLKKIITNTDVHSDWLLSGVGEIRFTEQTEPQSGVGQWKDEAFSSMQDHVTHLESEVLFYRNWINSLTAKIQAANFKNAFDPAGLPTLQIVESVRVAA
jgi:transcriptional regulator with XRE-family HTH domain